MDEQCCKEKNVNILTIGLNVLHNYLDGLKEIILDLYLTKFLEKFFSKTVLSAQKLNNKMKKLIGFLNNHSSGVVNLNHSARRNRHLSRGKDGSDLPGVTKIRRAATRNTMRRNSKPGNKIKLGTFGHFYIRDL